MFSIIGDQKYLATQPASDLPYIRDKTDETSEEFEKTKPPKPMTTTESITTDCTTIETTTIQTSTEAVTTDQPTTEVVTTAWPTTLEPTTQVPVS